MGNKIAVHESINSDRVVEFVNVNSLKPEIRNLIESGNLHGLSISKNGKICAVDIWGFIHTDIISDSLPVAREIVKELNKLYNEEIFVIDDYDDESDEVRIINAEYRYEGNDLHIRVEPYGTIKVSVTGISEQTFYGVADLLHAIDSIFSNENPD